MEMAVHFHIETVDRVIDQMLPKLDLRQPTALLVSQELLSNSDTPASNFKLER